MSGADLVLALLIVALLVLTIVWFRPIYPASGLDGVSDSAGPHAVSAECVHERRREQWLRTRCCSRCGIEFP